jgi:general secretion pathway protein L
MRPAHEANVTTAPSAEPRVAGVWTLTDGRAIINEAEGPATILVPTEQVRLLAVDLPLASRAKRLEALPFAVEDLIAEPAESVHLALGAEVAPKRYLVGVVGHAVMAGWIEAAEAAGLDHAAMVPDALALPQPGEGEWAVDLDGGRAVVRAGDGTGFAIPVAMLVAAWEAAGRPRVVSYGAALPAEMMAGQGVRDTVPLVAPALDLRQGPYARRRGSLPDFWRRLGWIAAIGVAAHVVIATADTLMLRSIADRRADETRALVAQMAPGATVGEDVAADVGDLIPVGGSSVPQTFLPLLNRVSGALGPLAGSITVRTIGFNAKTLTLDLDGADPGLPARIDAALRASRVSGTATRSADGTIRITASGA